MTTACGSVLAYLLSKMELDDKLNAEMLISYCSAENVKGLLLSKDISEVIDYLSKIFKDTIEDNMIPIIKLAFEIKNNKVSKFNKIAFLTYLTYCLNKIQNVELAIKAQNERLQELLNLRNAVYLTPNNLKERANWILNFKRFQLVYDQTKRIKFAFENQKYKQFNKFWYKQLNKQNETIKYLKMRLNDLTEINLQNQTLRRIAKQIRTFQNTLRNNIYQKSKSKRQKNYMFILQRKSKKLNKSIEMIQKIEKEKKFLLEDLNDTLECKHEEEIKQLVVEIDKQNEHNLQNIENKYGVCSELQDMLKLNRQIWDRLGISENKKKLNETKLKQDYLIQMLENGVGEYGTIKIPEAKSEDEDEKDEDTGCTDTKIDTKQNKEFENVDEILKKELGKNKMKNS